VSNKSTKYIPSSVELDPGLLRAFEETHFIVHHETQITLRVGKLNSDLDLIPDANRYQNAAFITAWNPMCQSLTDTENQVRQKLLIDEIKAQGFQCLHGIGKHPTNGWPGEESVLIFGISFRQATEMAKKFQQIAFVWLDRPSGSSPWSCQLQLTI
jgi:hypothetical protein